MTASPSGTRRAPAQNQRGLTMSVGGCPVLCTGSSAQEKGCRPTPFQALLRSPDRRWTIEGKARQRL